MIRKEEWLMIRNLLIQGLSKSEIARTLGINRKTVRDNLKKEHIPKYSRKEKSDYKLKDYEEYINIRLSKYNLSGQKIYEEILKQGYNGCYQTVSNYVSKLKNVYKRQAYLRFETLPGEQAQVDWGYFGEIYDVNLKKTIKLYGFFMILGYSRMKYLEFFTDQKTTNFLRGHNNAFEYFGGLTKEILYDNLKSVVIKRKLLSKDSDFNKRFIDFSGYYGFNPILCRPYKPNTKGKVENSVNYAKSNFFAGEEFTSLEDINNKVKLWLEKVNNINHSTTKEKPSERLKRENLLKINKFYDLSEIYYRKVLSDCHFSFKNNKYSVPYKYANSDISIKLINNKIEVMYRNEIIAEHKLNNIDKGIYITKPEHLYGLKELKIKSYPPNKYKKTFPEKLFFTDFVDIEVEKRSLKAYEEIF